MQQKTARGAPSRARARKASHDRPEQLPTWQNTRPRGNGETDRADMERSRERLEALLGR